MELGWSLSESLIALSEWGKEHATEVASARDAASFVPRERVIA